MGDLTNVMRRHLGRDRNALLIWGGIGAAVSAMVAAMYPGISDAYAELLEVYPESVIRALMGSGVVPFGSVEGFVALELFSWLPVLFGAYAALAGAGMVAEETDRGTVEFLLAQPLRRAAVVAGKFATFLIYLLGVLAVTGAGLWAGLVLADVTFDFAPFARMLWLDYLLAAAYGGVAVLLSTLLRDQRRSTSASLGVLFGTWFLSLVANVSDQAEELGYLSPFRYASPARVLETGAVDPLDAGVLAGVAVVALAAAIVHFERKDVTT